MKHQTTLVLLVLAGLAIVLVSCETLFGAAAQMIDPELLGQAVGDAIAPQLDNLVASLIEALKPKLAAIPGIQPDQITALTGAMTDGLAGLKGTILEAITNGLVAAMPEPPDGERLGLVGQLVGFAITSAATYYGVNLRRDSRRKSRNEAV